KARVLNGRMHKSASSHPTGLAMIQRTAEADVVRLRRYEIPIRRVARNWCLDPALIAALMSQESRVSLLPGNDWDQYQQVHRDDESQNSNVLQRPFGLWDNEENINQGSTMLVLAINDVRARHPTWTWDRQLR
ncbi:LYG protein, partial [Baryphthengus martii]|nr:LYG protein [Baryphthengus martii]